MEMSVEQIRDVKVVHPTGCLDARASAEFQEALIRLLDEGDKWFVVDFTQTKQIDGTVVRALLMLSRKAAALAGGLVLCGVNDQVRRAFEVAGLADKFALFASPPDAVDHLVEQQEVQQLSDQAVDLLRRAGAKDEPNQEDG